MARSHARIYASIWSDSDWRALSQNAQHCYMMLLSQPKLSLCGSLDVMEARWANGTRDMTVERLREGLAELEQGRFVVVDEDELVIRRFITHDLSTMNRNMIKGMWSAWGVVTSDVLRKVIVDNMPKDTFEREGVEVPELAVRMREKEPLALPLTPEVCS